MERELDPSAANEPGRREEPGETGSASSPAAAPTPALAPAPAPAPAPRPPLGQAHLARPGQGFDPKVHKFLIEVLVLGVVVAGLGAMALWGGGALAAALTPVIPLSVDQKLGELSHSSLLADECPNPAARKYVEELARPLLEAAGPLPFEFQFRVVDDSSINAFALPGGFVTVNSGLLEAAETGEEVAGVLGHEIQHALLRHGMRRILREMGGSVALSILLGGSDLHTYGEMASRLTGLSYDRDQESEADRDGVALLVAAGIDPAGLARFFERLTEEGLRPPELLSTHPDPGNRAAAIRAAKLPGPARKLALPSSAQCRMSPAPSEPKPPEGKPAEPHLAEPKSGSEPSQSDGSSGTEPRAAKPTKSIQR